MSKWMDFFSQFFPFFSFAHEDDDEIVRKVRIDPHPLETKERKEKENDRKEKKVEKKVSPKIME